MMNARTTAKAATAFKIALVALCAALALCLPARALADDADSSSSPATGLTTGTIDNTAADTADAAPSSFGDVRIKYRTYMEDLGWQPYVKGSRTSGAMDQGIGVKGMRVKLTGLGTNTGQVYCRVHVQGGTWQKGVKDGVLAGSTGDLGNIDAVKIRLMGDVANQFDVFYRVYVQDAGWQPWKTNYASAGKANGGARIEAIQIKLSAKTEEAARKGADTVGVRYQTRIRERGWRTWVGDGATSGATTKVLPVYALKVNVSTGGAGGGVYYRVHYHNKGWQATAKNGAIAGVSKGGAVIDALRVKLKGAIANTHDVYYRAYVQGHGWLDWASNWVVAGSTGYGSRIQAVQIMLKAKGEEAPGPTELPTLNKIAKANKAKATLNGIDIASWQYDINVPVVDADFVIVKATGGIGYTNPYFRSHADAVIRSGKLLGLYHYAREKGCSGSATQEADFFCNAVADYVGKAVLVLDWEADALELGPSWAKKFLDRVYKRTGVRPLIYVSKSTTWYYDWSQVARKYKLWVAQYPNYETTGYKENPWTDNNGYGAWSAPTMFQYTSSGRISGYGGNLDLNKFYGNRSAWRKLAKKS